MDAIIILWICVGVVAGVLVGAVPGLTGAMAISLVVPLTFGMEPQHALALLVAIYVGSVSGGLISSTFLNIVIVPAGYSLIFRGSNHPPRLEEALAQANQLPNQHG